MVPIDFRHWRWRLRAFYPTNKGGGLAIEVGLNSEGARLAEIGACRARMQRGELGRVEIVDTERPFDVVEVIQP